MGCSSCATGKDGVPKGCKSNGNCARKGHCIQMMLGVVCSCDVYLVSGEDNLLARGNTLCVTVY